MQADSTKVGRAIAERSLKLGFFVVLIAIAATACVDANQVCSVDNVVQWVITQVQQAIPASVGKAVPSQSSPPAAQRTVTRGVTKEATSATPSQKAAIPVVEAPVVPAAVIPAATPVSSPVDTANVQATVAAPQRANRSSLHVNKRTWGPFAVLMDANTTWLVAVGVLCVILLGCLMYLLLQMSVLRRHVDELTININTSRTLLEERVKEANAISRDVAAMHAQSASNNNNSSSADHAEMVVKLRSLEKELASQQIRMTDFIQRAQAERAASLQSPPRASVEQGLLADASFAGIVGGSPKVRPAASPIAESTDANFSLDASQSMVRALGQISDPKTQKLASLSTRSAHRGLGFSLPPKMWVYERVSGDPRDCVMKKRLHSIALGHNGDVNTPGEICFLFAAVDAARGADLSDMMAEAARNRAGAVGVTCIPANSILLMEVKPASRDLVEAMGPVAGDGQNLLVSVHRSSVSSTSSLLTTAPQANRTTASWSAASEAPADARGANGERSASMGVGRLDRRAFLRTTSTGTSGHAVSDRPFVFFIPSSIASEEWVTFVSNLLQDRVKIVDGGASTSFFEL